MLRTYLWMIAVLALAIFANLPRSLGPLKPDLGYAGFPLIYAN